MSVQSRKRHHTQPTCKCCYRTAQAVYGAVFTMDSPALGLAPLGGGGRGACFRTRFYSVRLGSTMVCDVISAATEFTVRVLHSRGAIGIHDIV
jgi:hypothetical protein